MLRFLCAVFCAILVSGCAEEISRKTVCVVDPISYATARGELRSKLFAVIDGMNNTDMIDLYIMGSNKKIQSFSLGQVTDRAANLRKVAMKKWVATFVDSLHLFDVKHTTVPSSLSSLVEILEREERAHQNYLFCFSDALYKGKFDKVEVDMRKGRLSDSFVTKGSSPYYVRKADLSDYLVIISTTDKVPVNQVFLNNTQRFYRLYFQRLNAYLEYYGPDTNILTAALSGKFSKYKEKVKAVDGPLMFTPYASEALGGFGDWSYCIVLEAFDKSSARPVDIDFDVLDVHKQVLFSSSKISSNDFLLQSGEDAQRTLYLNRDPRSIVLDIAFNSVPSTKVETHVTIYSDSDQKIRLRQTFESQGDKRKSVGPFDII